MTSVASALFDFIIFPFTDPEADTLGISTFYKTLTFSNISKDDAGEYSCTVESHDKQIHTEKITIEVIGKLLNLALYFNCFIYIYIYLSFRFTETQFR